MATTVLDRLIEPIAECLTIEAATKVASLRADVVDQQRLDELAEKANQGTLSAEERSDYDRLLAAFHFMTIIQARARRLLQAG